MKNKASVPLCIRFYSIVLYVSFVIFPTTFGNFIRHIPVLDLLADTLYRGTA